MGKQKMSTNRKNSAGRKSAWKLALLCSLPIWALLIADTIAYTVKLSVLTTLYLHAPGYVLWVTLNSSWQGVHDPNILFIGAFNCLFYYLVILAGIAIWRRVKRRDRERQ